MRWSKEPKPELGDKRTLHEFLFTPLTIGLETRWLERAAWQEEYVRAITGNEYWTPIRWIAPISIIGYQTWAREQLIANRPVPPADN